MNIAALENAALDRLALAQDRKGKRFKLYSDLSATSKKIWLVKNLLGAGEASAFYGAPGSGKSALAEDLGLHIAGGLPWHGRDVMQGAVCYFALERHALVERRAIAFREYRKIENLPFALAPGPFEFLHPDTPKQIIEVVREIEGELDQKVALIILDTISRALSGGDENSSKDMGRIVGATGQIQAATNAHALWVHHVPVDNGDRLRGHGALLGALDSTINIEKVSAELRTATVIKANDSEEGERVSFRLESVTIGEETTAPVVLPAEDQPRQSASGPTLSKNQQTMFSILHDVGQAGLSLEQWNERTRQAGIGQKRKADLHDIRTALKTKGLVREFNGRWNACE